MATRVQLSIDAGTTYSTTITLQDQNDNYLDVTGMTANAELRRNYHSVNSVSFSTSLSNGSLTLSLTPAQTLDLESGKFVYDVTLTDDSGNVSRLIEGIAIVNPAVTKAD
jgi:hypothetical protein